MLNPWILFPKGHSGWPVGVLTVALVFGNGLPAPAGALEDYVRAPDTHFAYQVLSQRPTNEQTITRLRLTSQQWREHVWHHELRIITPKTVRNGDFAFLFITGDGIGEDLVQRLAAIATRAGAVAAVVADVPNQPLYDGRHEDALIAYTFDQYLKTGDATWPLLFPMVKSATKAMDAVTQFRQSAGAAKITRFVVSGASKRGWTTWLTAAVDSRVSGIAPMVIDMLNMKAQAQWADKVYGRQSEQIHDYTDLGLIARMDEPAMVRLRRWVDPYSYRQRYSMPKLILLGTNDPYWTVDSLRHYWNDLPEPKLIYQTPNAGHGLNGGEHAFHTLAAFTQMIADREKLPELTWHFQDGPVPMLSVTTSPGARSVRLWSVASADRDFRDDKSWAITQEVQPQHHQTKFKIAKPTRGYRASLAEAVLTTRTGEEYRLSTEAWVVPDLPQ